MKTLYFLPILIIGIANAHPTPDTDPKDSILQNAANELMEAIEEDDFSSLLLNANWEADLNATEDEVKKRKIEMIGALFDAKRQVIRTLGDLKNAKGKLLQEAIEQVANASQSVATGLSVSKQIAVNITNSLTFENINSTLYNTINNINQALNNTINGFNQALWNAYNATTNHMTQTGTQLIYSLLKSKENLHNLLENFNSQQSFQNGSLNIGLVINATLHGAEQTGAQVGLFQAIDSLVHGLGQIPLKINRFIKSLIFGEENMDAENEKKDRPKREIVADFESMSTEELDQVIEDQAHFWNNLNQIIEKHMLKINERLR